MWLSAQRYCCRLLIPMSNLSSADKSEVYLSNL